MNGHRIISVFGGSSPRPGEPAYAEAMLVGRLLAEAGFTVATGGYIGTMEAVSRGAREAGGHVIGVTSGQIEQFRPVGPNRWVVEEVKYQTLRERLLHLVTQNDGMIVLPGGVGTLAELSLAWNLLQVGEISPRPLVALGTMWRATLAAFVQREYVKQEHAALMRTAETAQEAVAHLVHFGE